MARSKWYRNLWAKVWPKRQRCAVSALGHTHTQTHTLNVLMSVLVWFKGCCFDLLLEKNKESGLLIIPINNSSKCWGFIVLNNITISVLTRQWFQLADRSFDMWAHFIVFSLISSPNEYQNKDSFSHSLSSASGLLGGRLSGWRSRKMLVFRMENCPWKRMR